MMMSKRLSNKLKSVTPHISADSIIYEIFISPEGQGKSYKSGTSRQFVIYVKDDPILKPIINIIYNLKIVIVPLCKKN